MRQRAKGLFPVVYQQMKVGLAAMVDDATLVGVVLALLAGGDGWAVAKQAHQQQHVGKDALFWCDPNIDEGVQVKQAHFDVFHAIFLQCLGGPLTGLTDPLGPDAGVKLVLDLQHVGVELFPMGAVTHTEFFVKRIEGANRRFQPLGVLGQGVETDVQLVLRVVLVAQIAHAQAGGVGAKQSAGHEFLQVGGAAL